MYVSSPRKGIIIQLPSTLSGPSSFLVKGGHRGFLGQTLSNCIVLDPNTWMNLTQEEELTDVQRGQNESEQIGLAELLPYLPLKHFFVLFCFHVALHTHQIKMESFPWVLGSLLFKAPMSCKTFIK